ncbi:MAG TPA: DUF6249 domain-containing protein [Gammaproteobacteria bacterium]
MGGSTWRRRVLLVAGVCVSPLALAQETPYHEMTASMTAFVGLMAALGMLFVVAIVATASYFQQRQMRERMSLIERLVLADKPVPRHLITGEIPPLPLPDERRRDIRRGITLLCWAISVAAIPVIGSGGQWRYGVWGLLFLLPSLGSFFKAWLTAREIARGASSGAPQP